MAPPNTANYMEKIPKHRGRCTSCLCMSWKVFTCIFSHVMLITLVVAYCLMGSYLFEWLEADNERHVCNNMVSQPKIISNYQVPERLKYVLFLFFLYFWLMDR